MRILGIGDHVSCGSAIVEDGKVIAAITDERLVREKMVFGVPRESIKALLEQAGLGPEEIDEIAVATVNQHIVDGYVDFRDGWFGLKRSPFKQALFIVASKVSKLREKIPLLEKAYYALRQGAFKHRRRRIEEIMRKEFGFRCPVTFLDHHYCHCASAYYTSGFDEATVFSIDGGGDARSAKVYHVKDGRFEELCAISSFNSLGTFYSYITEICGFKAGRHEGKITGLAAYGEPVYLPQLRALLDFKDGKFVNVGQVFFLSALKEIQNSLPPDFAHKDLAASVQQHAEDLVTKLVSWWVEHTGARKVALAGGVCANVKINQRVLELPQVEEVYVHPGMSDEGLPVGAALARYHELQDRAPVRDAMRTVYLGPSYDDERIKQALDEAGIEAEYLEEIDDRVAQLLADKAVVARFDGAMEYGPRALGNRSILYHPGDPSVHFWLNDALKRTEFMPFAPVMLAEDAADCFVNWEGGADTARFMTITFDCTDRMAEQCPGVVHIDKTARPQLVHEEDNPRLYRLISRFKEITGIPALINTSFNMHEEPIVCTPEDAIRAFTLGHLEYLAIGHWLARNPSPLPRNADRSKFDATMNRRGPVRRF